MEKWGTVIAIICVVWKLTNESVEIYINRPPPKKKKGKKKK